MMSPEENPPEKQQEPAAQLPAHPTAETRDEAARMLDVDTRREAKLAELHRRREAGEIDPLDYAPACICYLADAGLPLTRADLLRYGRQAVVLTPEALNEVREFDMLLANGETARVEPDHLSPGDVLIIYPDDLGDVTDGAVDGD